MVIDAMLIDLECLLMIAQFGLQLSQVDNARRTRTLTEGRLLEGWNDVPHNGVTQSCRERSLARNEHDVSALADGLDNLTVRLQGWCTITKNQPNCKLIPFLEFRGAAQ